MLTYLTIPPAGDISITGQGIVICAAVPVNVTKANICLLGPFRSLSCAEISERRGLATLVAISVIHTGIRCSVETNAYKVVEPVACRI
jgi:hypothetical protein